MKVLSSCISKCQVCYNGLRDPTIEALVNFTTMMEEQVLLLRVWIGYASLFFDASCGTVSTPLPNREVPPLAYVSSQARCVPLAPSMWRSAVL